MGTASRADQLKLLEVAEIDARLARLRRDDAKHPLREEVGKDMNLLAAKARDITAAAEALTAAEAELDEASAKVAKIAADVARGESRLNAGEGMDSRELMKLSDEIATQRKMLDAASDAEFAALEAVDGAQAKIDKLEAQRQTLNERLVAGRADLEDAIDAISRDIADVQAKRDAIFEPLAEDLKREYTRSQSRGGIAVLAVHPNGDSSAGIRLSPIEVAQVRNAPEDEIYLSEDYDCIVVALDA